MHCQVSGTGVARKQLQRFHYLCYPGEQNLAIEVKSVDVIFKSTFSSESQLRAFDGP